MFFAIKFLTLPPPSVGTKTLDWVSIVSEIIIRHGVCESMGLGEKRNVHEVCLTDVGEGGEQKEFFSR